MAEKMTQTASAATTPAPQRATSAPAQATPGAKPTAKGAAKAPQKRKPQPRQRRIPQRTCIMCKQERPKRELIRIVRTPDGHVLLDPTGKKSGRGAYLCAKRSCWEPALRKGRLEHEFGVAISLEDRAALDAYVDSLPSEAPDPAAARPKRAPKAPKTANAE
ncbi:MAG TPA: DUF448 domain-containing protein [Ktedonobacterales bacterium]|nr:DUF448 domain-containing protein [Ktedonobacterales bacterium]